MSSGMEFMFSIRDDLGNAGFLNLDRMTYVAMPSAINDVPQLLLLFQDNTIKLTFRSDARLMDVVKQIEDRFDEFLGRKGLEFVIKPNEDDVNEEDNEETEEENG